MTRKAQLPRTIGAFEAAAAELLDKALARTASSGTELPGAQAALEPDDVFKELGYRREPLSDAERAKAAEVSVGSKRRITRISTEDKEQAAQEIARIRQEMAKHTNSDIAQQESGVNVSREKAAQGIVAIPAVREHIHEAVEVPPLQGTG